MRYDGETGLYWLSVRAYDPSLGRFLSRDPLNRAPLFFSDQPYVYAGNNPLIHVDPSGQRFYIEGMSGGEQEQVNKWMIKAAQRYRTKSKGGKKHPKGGSQGEAGGSKKEAGGSQGEAGGSKKEAVGSQGEAVGGNRDTLANRALWRNASPDRMYFIWLGAVEHDTKSGWHANLHITWYPSSGDLFNFHIKWKEDDGLSLIWTWRDYVPGVEETDVEHDVYGWDRLPDWAAGTAASTMLSQIAAYTGLSYLTSIERHGVKLQDALAGVLKELAEQRFENYG